MSKRNAVSLWGLLIFGLLVSLDTRQAYGPDLSGRAVQAAPGQSWQIEIVDLDGGSSPSLALDEVGQPRIAYFGTYDSYLYGLLYARYVDFDWQIETMDGNGSDHASLALDALGDPHISYYSISQGDLYYAHYYNESWHVQGVDTAGDVGKHSALALDAAGRPHIAYWDAGNQAVKYARRAGAVWEIETVDVVGGYGDEISLVLDAADRPHLSYRDDGADTLIYAYFDGSNWQVEVVDDTGYWAGEYNDLALDAQGHPHISYSNQGLKYAYHDGTAWHVRLLIDDHLAGDFNAIALDAQGYPHISFSQWNYPDEMWLRYAYFDGFDWQIETVDTQAGSGWYRGTSLALGGEAAPHIAYWDSQMDTLKYAVYREPCTGVESVAIEGPGRLPVGIEGQYEASYAPAGATLPVLYAWDNGASEEAAAYSWPATGTYTVAVTATNLCGQATGTFDVEVFCQPLSGVGVGGPLALLVDQGGTYRATARPVTATLPLTITWSNGGAGPTATYSWATTGTHTLTVTATNLCGVVQVASLPVRVWADWPYKVHLPLVLLRE